MITLNASFSFHYAEKIKINAMVYFQKNLRFKFNNIEIFKEKPVQDGMKTFVYKSC